VAKSKIENEVQKRVDDVMQMSAGTMPIEILFRSKNEAEMARQYLKGKKGNKLITVTVEENNPKSFV
jgi:hypothetical protein